MKPCHLRCQAFARSHADTSLYHIVKTNNDAVADLYLRNLETKLRSELEPVDRKRAPVVRGRQAGRYGPTAWVTTILSGPNGLQGGKSNLEWYICRVVYHVQDQKQNTNWSILIFYCYTNYSPIMNPCSATSERSRTYVYQYQTCWCPVQSAYAARASAGLILTLLTVPATDMMYFRQENTTWLSKFSLSDKLFVKNKISALRGQTSQIHTALFQNTSKIVCFKYSIRSKITD